MWLEVRLFLVALKTLTRFPLPAWVGWKSEWAQHSLRHFPGVGLLVGSGGAAVLWMAGHAWPALVSVLVSMAFTMWLTGARHEAGWALVCDGRALAMPGVAAVAVRPMAPAAEAGAAPAQDAPEGAAGDEAQAATPPAAPAAPVAPLATQPPARALGGYRPLGAAGAAGLALVLALKASALHGLVLRDLAVMLATLVLAHVWSRAAIVLALWWRQQGPGRQRAGVPAASEGQHDGLGLPLALLWCALATGVASLFVPAPGLLLAAAAVLGTGLLWNRLMQTHPAVGTAAGLDALQQWGELSVYLALLAHLAQG